MKTSQPLVTLGVPVRNGAPMLGVALDCIVGQDYPNLQVIISDNASTDATAAIAQAYADRYPFVRYVRHETPLSAVDNFQFVLDEAQGEFFAWCAHDDTRSTNFVKGLVPAFEDPSTVLAFGDLYVWREGSPPQLRADYDFATDGLPLVSRMRKAAHLQCYHYYGLWRLTALRSIRYRPTRWWGDVSIMLAACALGQFRHVSGPQFHYYEVRKSAEQRAIYQDYRSADGHFMNLLTLFRSVAITVWRTAGPWPALIATICAGENWSRRIFNLIGRRLRRSQTV